MNTTKLFGTTLVAVTIASAIATIPAFAQMPPVPTSVNGLYRSDAQIQGMPQGGMHGDPRDNMKPGVFGTVSTISGTTLTITGKEGFGQKSATTTYTVDASNATVHKNNATSTISSITVGDTVMVQGTISGTSVIATSIRDGIMMRGGPNMMDGKGREGMSSSTSPMTGNGQPVIAGTISAISGSSITITNKSNVSYTVDASNAKIVQGQNTITVSNLTVGTSVIVQGSVNGNSVTATSIIDQVQPTPNGTTDGQTHTNDRPGFFGGIGHFFMHLFGF